MFPIFDSNGKVIAFTGRVLNSEQKETPKYVNSPETNLFSKSHVLYGLNFAKQSIRKHNFVILVEGQMDVIMSHQMGYSNTVASSGTAFTSDQLHIISKNTPNLLLAFDSDSAGLATTAKVWEMAINEGLDVKIAYYEGLKDPADIIKENPDIWKETIKKSIHIIEFVARLVAKIEDERKRIKAYQERILPLLKRVHTYSEKNFFIEKISSLISINSSIIWSDVSLTQTTESTNVRMYEQVEKKAQEPLLNAYIHFFSKQNPEIKNSINEFLQKYQLQMFDEQIIDEKKLFEIENMYEKESGQVKKDFKELFSGFILSLLKNKNKQIKNILNNQNSEQQLVSLKQMGEYKKLIDSVNEKDCQFINNMV